MLRRFAPVIPVVGLVAALALGASPGLASTVPGSHGRASHVHVVSSPIRFGGGALNPSTGKVTLSGAARYSDAPASSGDDCYIKTEKNKRFKGYKPWHTTDQGNSYYADWLDQLYSVSKAATSSASATRSRCNSAPRAAATPTTAGSSGSAGTGSTPTSSRRTTGPGTGRRASKETLAR